jgi:hypothetical protein
MTKTVPGEDELLWVGEAVQQKDELKKDEWEGDGLKEDEQEDAK